MTYISRELKTWFADSIYTAANELYQGCVEKEHVVNSISVPKKEFGDMSSSIAIRISKAAGKSPAEIAKAIAALIKHDSIISEINIVAGYINAKINEKEYAEKVIGEVNSMMGKYGSMDVGNRKTVLIEFPAVNPNKPWHVGHLRNALLGDSISKILEFASYNVEREDYIDDLGLQIAEIVWGYTNMDSKPDKKFDQWLGEQYVEVNKVMEERNAKGQISQILKKMEDSSTRESELARELASRCVAAQYETAYSYGIYHDVMIWESDIVRARLLERMLRIGIEKGALEKPASGKNAGCIIVSLDKVRSFAADFENPEEKEKVLVRSDGTATYVAKDIAFHMWKLGILDADFRYTKVDTQENARPLYSTAAAGEELGFGNADKVVNIIGSAQRYPQLILKAILSLMGYADKASNIIHMAYGEVSVEAGNLSGRSGGWIGEGKAYTADVLLGEAQAKALEATQNSKKIEDRDRVKDIAAEIGKAAIKFEYLKVSPERPLVFSWTRALSFEGNSGPYCMYSYARARRILGKGGYSSGSVKHDAYGKVERGYDFELVKLIGSAGEVVEKAATEYKPSVIADYVIDLTAMFSKFYEAMPVINSDAKEFRMELINAYAQVLSNMLALLGIGTVEQM